jgi:hypothetical protein
VIPIYSANLIALLKEYGDSIEGFRERVGEDFARGHKEATGGIINKVGFGRIVLVQRPTDVSLSDARTNLKDC